VGGAVFRAERLDSDHARSQVRLVRMRVWREGVKPLQAAQIPDNVVL
jgi:hypothetical protein